MYNEYKKKAVALRYRKGKDKAPKLVAKGVAEIAEKIIKVARDENVPIIKDENAATEFFGLDLNVEVPPELYKVAAEILAFIYCLDKKTNDR
jgi:flagellar biosynthesis protein